MATAETFPDEIMLAILIRLPVKSIVRCNSLSKHYYSLIHSPFFVRKHLLFGRTNKVLDKAIVCLIKPSLRLFERSGIYITISSLWNPETEGQAIVPPIQEYVPVVHQTSVDTTISTLGNPATEGQSIVSSIQESGPILDQTGIDETISSPENLATEGQSSGSSIQESEIDRCFDMINNSSIDIDVNFASMFAYERRICGPVDGLYCMVDPEDVIDGQEENLSMIWNPATRERFSFCRLSPLFDDIEPDSSLHAACPSLVDYYRVLEVVAYGFGYDCIKNDYKVLMVCGVDIESIDASKINSFYIFNVREGVWRNLEECLGIVPWNIKSQVGVFLRGACHWLYMPHPQNDYKIFAFDMSKEVHQFIPLPSVLDGKSWTSPSIVSLNGSLGLVHGEGGDTELDYSSFDVWVMEDYGESESWTMLYHVSLELGGVGRFLGIIQERFYVNKGDGCLVSYGLNSGDVECYDIQDSIHCLLPYEESLVCIVKSD